MQIALRDEMGARLGNRPKLRQQGLRHGELERSGNRGIHEAKRVVGGKLAGAESCLKIRTGLKCCE